MKLFVLDTNLFFNMSAGFGMGSKSEEVIRNVTVCLQKKKDSVSGCMPPNIVDEFLSFFEDTSQPFIQTFLSTITTQSPDYNNMSVQAAVFRQLIEDIRFRSYRGMTVGEEEIRAAGQLFMGTEMLPRKAFEMTIGPKIKTFRERYRTATRIGFLDSVADLDLIMLAKEQNATLVTSDEGVTKWAREFGVTEMQPATFGEVLRQKDS